MKRVHYEFPRPPRHTRDFNAAGLPLPPHLRPPESLIEKLTRDLEAWRLAKGVIARAKRRAN